MCRIYVATPIECYGLLDMGNEQYRVHTWLDRTLRIYETRSETLDDADIAFFNASFSFRHPLRYPCFAALDTFARSTNKTVYAVSFGETDFFPRHNRLRLTKNVHWVIMDSRGGKKNIVVPFSISKPAWLVGLDFSQPRTDDWLARKAFFMAGHIPKLHISSLRYRVYAQLKARADATAFATGSNVSVQERLSPDEYHNLAMRHRFCIAASGDNFATPKMTESVLFAAHGGCLPIIVSSNQGKKWPFETRFRLRKHGIFTTLSTFESTIERAARMTESEASAMRRFYQSIAPSYQSVVRDASASRTTIVEMCLATE